MITKHDIIQSDHCVWRLFSISGNASISLYSDDTFAIMVIAFVRCCCLLGCDNLDWVRFMWQCRWGGTICCVGVLCKVLLSLDVADSSVNNHNYYYICHVEVSPRRVNTLTSPATSAAYCQPIGLFLTI